MKKQYNIGLSGEKLAEDHLCQQGMTVMARRYRAGDGEIDLIMQDDCCIVFVEVKSRPRCHAGTGLCYITPVKQRRIIHAAYAFLVEREYLDMAVRFDVVEITFDGILHIRNAFTADV